LCVWIPALPAVKRNTERRGRGNEHALDAAQLLSLSSGSKYAQSGGEANTFRQIRRDHIFQFAKALGVPASAATRELKRLEFLGS
jgi:hypothetical protein